MMALKKDMEVFLWFFLLTVVLIGGVNWLVTAIRNMHGGGETDDLLSLMHIPQDVNNIIYILVFVASLVVFLWAIFYKLNKRVV